MNNREEMLYIRKFGSAEFEESENVDFFNWNLLLLKSDAFTKSKKYFCKTHKEWEKVSDIGKTDICTVTGEKFYGIPVEFAAEKNYENSYEEKFGSYTYKRLLSENIFSKRSSQLTYRHSAFNKVKKWNQVNENFYDEDEIEKDFFAFSACFDYEKKYLFIRSFYLDREKIKEENSLLNYKTIPLVKNECYCKIGKCFMITGEKNRTIIPSRLSESFNENIHRLLNSWAGKEITYNTCLKQQQLLMAITEAPYEPNVSPLNVNIQPFSYTDSNVYNIVIEKLGIKSYPVLRKMFYKNPFVLFKYKHLISAGFTDINIINHIMDSKESDILLSERLELVLKQFFTYAIKDRGDKVAWNVLIKNPTDSRTFYDGIEMFNDYYDKLPESVKKSIYNDGFTKYNHDVLSKIITDINNANVEFEYTGDQLNLEDEIEGFKFKLPPDSDALRNIGSELHNCVASYKKKVINKECTIIFVEKDDNKLICIEVQGCKVWQERADHNGNPSAECTEILNKWHKRKNLVVSY